jgi:hypothetical protein
VSVDSNYNLTLSVSTTTQTAADDSAYNAVAALTPTTAIAAFQGTGSDGFAGTLTLTPTPVISGQLLGIAETSATNGATASVAIGPIVAGTYTSGADYYAAGAGGLTVTPTPVHVGKAKTTTELVLDLRGAPEAGKQNVWEITTPGAFTWTAPENGEYEIMFCGGGASGIYNTGTGGMGGNGGNTKIINCSFLKDHTLTGNLGSGGAAKTTSADGNAGANSTVTLFGKTYTAEGGIATTLQGGVASASSPYKCNNNLDGCILGTTGIRYNDGSTPITAGGMSLLTKSPVSARNSEIGVDGSRGGGGSGGGASSYSGKGGDGCLRITLVHGS